MTTLPTLPRLKTLLWVILGFFALTGAIYGQSLRNDFVRWDDGMLVYENPAIRAINPQTLKHIFTTYDPELYIPLTFLSYQVDYKVGGQNAFIYHLHNLILHTLNALLVAWLVYLLSKRRWVALACGLLFAVHPLHTEAVEWVSARKDVLSGFYFLLSVIAYLYWRDRDEKKYLILSLIAFALGLMSKVMVITLPVVLLLTDDLERRRYSWRMLWEKWPYFGLSVLFGLIGVFGKTGVIESSSTLSKVLMACKSALFYLQKIVVPHGFSLLYPYVKPITIASPDFYVPVLLLILFIAVAIASRRRMRTVFFGFAFYLVTVAPTFLNFAKGGDLDIYFASDRYSYLPSIGIFFLLCSLLWMLLERRANSAEAQDRMGIFAAVMGVVVLACSALALRQSFVWQNTETLFANVIRYYPESSYVAHNNLGNVYRLDGDNAKAEAEYKQSLAIRPHAKTLSNLGAVYRKEAKFDEALATYAEALKLDSKSKEAHFGLGLVYLNQGHLGTAEEEFQTALKIDSHYEEAYTNLGAIYISEGKLTQAIEAYRKALVINEFFPDARYNLAVALEQAGDPQGAQEQYEQVTMMVPAFVPAHVNLGLLYAKANRTQDAIRQFQTILRYDPQNRSALSALRQLGAEAQ